MKSIIVGLDAFDPVFFEELHNQGKTPNLSKYVENNGYSHFSISNPAQSEVSWTSIATGQNPGGHGIFDFVHRNPKNYNINVSLLQTKQSLIGLQFTPPYNAETIFDRAIEKGYPATSLWWPATFPARLTSPVFSIPGLGTPDIMGKLGVGLHFSLNHNEGIPDKTTILELKGSPKSGYFTGRIPGPLRTKGNQTKETYLDFSLEFIDEKTAKLKLGKNQQFTLEVGRWSPVIEFGFKMSMLITLKTVTRVIITQGARNPKLYFLPLQIHPLSSAWPYGSPRNFISSTWKRFGPYLTLGWPQDTTGLEEDIITDQQFLSLCESIFETRKNLFLSQLNDFTEGVLGVVFDTLDRVQHMFWKTRPDLIEQWYLKLDKLIGNIENSLKNNDTQLLILSDHGFKNYDYKVNFNKWLIDHNYLFLKNGRGEQNLSNVDWEKSRAYALGLNSLYLNQMGREGNGIVKSGEVPVLLKEIKNELLSLKGPDGNQVVKSIYTKEETIEGPYSHLGPDLFIGYSPGYRASADTGIGKWNEQTIETNSDHWNADHCIDPESVDGVIFRNKGLTNFPSPSYKDIPPMVVGDTLRPGTPPDSDFSDEDRETVEERLKGLGYL